MGSEAVGTRPENRFDVSEMEASSGVTKTYYMGDWLEYDGSESTSYYYYLNGQRVATRMPDGTVYWIHGDHLGSAVVTTDDALTITTGSHYYYPYRAFLAVPERASPVGTPYRFTGQREEEDLGLYFYKSRWYNAQLRRFIQPDTVVPQPGNPQALNRYSYTLNNPVRYTDPSGHAAFIDADANLLENPATGSVMVADIAGSYLYASLAQASVGHAPALERLEELPGATAGLAEVPPAREQGGQAVLSALRGIAAGRGDAGFAPAFRDDCLYEEYWGVGTPFSRQLGHFLTAVDLTERWADRPESCCWPRTVGWQCPRCNTPSGWSPRWRALQGAVRGCGSKRCSWV